MSSTTLSDVVLSITTIIFGLTVGPQKQRWTALFLCLGFAAGFGALFHGWDRFHTKEFWTLVSTTATASGFLFLACVITIVKPQAKWAKWLWPLFAVAGIIIGAFLSSFSFFYISLVSGAALLIAILILPRAPKTKARTWISLGIGLTIIGLICQHWVGNPVFHYFQLAANGCFWLGARGA